MSDNSQSITNGGGLLVLGGASIIKDLYIGGDVYNYGIVNYNQNTFKFINSSLRFSIDRDSSSNNFSVSRYNTSGSLIEKSLDISYSTGSITLNNTTASVSLTTGAFISKGGITISNTTNSLNPTNGGALTIFGGTSISQDLYVNGQTKFTNTTISTNYNNGSVLCSGGVGITGDLNILGNTTITGNLTVSGTVSSVSSTNTLITDNILLLNSGPTGTADSGFLVQRYQTPNDSALGDVVNDISTTEFTDILPSQTGMTSTQVKLSSSANATAGFYNNTWIKITSGLSTNQVRKITAYTGATRIATILTSFTTQNPDIGDTVKIYNRPFVGLVWNEVFDRFEFGSVIEDPGTAQIAFTQPASLKLDQGIFVSSVNSINASTGSIVLSGGVAISSTYDATNSSVGGSLTIAGGGSIAKKLFVGTSITVNGVAIIPNTYDIPSTISFTGSNNISNANITPLLFANTVWGVDIFISVQLIATTNLYSNYHLRCTNMDTLWNMSNAYTGDSIIVFNITTSGQIQYTCPNYSGFTSLTFKFKAITN
jgi:hypothetical protein